MKKIILLLIFCSISTQVLAQLQSEFEKDQEAESSSAITIGILNGGGSLIGADFEVLISDHVGVQIGAGLIGFGAGLNYHFKPSIRSSFISLQYWNQGIGERFSQNVLGMNYVHRGKKWFTFQIGLGATLKEGPAFPETIEQAPVILMYSIGIYLPNKG